MEEVGVLIEEEEEEMVEDATERYGEPPTGRRPNMKLHTERSLGSLAMAQTVPAASELHPMEGVKVLTTGVAYSKVKTREGRVLVVPNEELRAARKAAARRAAAGHKAKMAQLESALGAAGVKPPPKSSTCLLL